MRRALLASAAALLAAAALAASGCGSSSAPAAEASQFEGTPWILASGVVDLTAAGDAEPTATFSGGTVSGFAGCNRYHATYTAAGDTIAIGKAITTQIACGAAVADMEHRYLVALQNADKWSVVGGNLSIVDDGGNTILGYRAASPVGKWVATQLRGPTAVAAPLTGSLVTAEFGPGGELTGTSGCNRYHATYTVTGGDIAITPPAATKAGCTKPFGVMEQESTYLANLTSAARFETSGGTLTLLKEDGTIVAIYRADKDIP